MHVDVHYYEDGNVRLTAEKPLALSSGGGGATAPEMLRQIALAENGYQQELNRGLADLSEGAFKGLRRQLPVTRQKVSLTSVRRCVRLERFKDRRADKDGIRSTGIRSEGTNSARTSAAVGGGEGVGFA